MENERQQVQMTLTQEVKSPLPLASEVAGYENLLPGSADRILTMVEKQMQHRQELEKAEIKADTRNSFYALIFAFIFAMSVLVGSIALIVTGHAEAAALVGVGGIGAVVGAFLQNKKKVSQQ